jgi:hypothetical protein
LRDNVKIFEHYHPLQAASLDLRQTENIQQAVPNDLTKVVAKFSELHSRGSSQFHIVVTSAFHLLFPLLLSFPSLPETRTGRAKKKTPCGGGVKSEKNNVTLAYGGLKLKGR